MDLLTESEEELAYFRRPEGSIYTRPVAKRGTQWGDLVLQEIEWIWKIRAFCDQKGAGVILRQFISNSPYRDISLLTWCVSLFGLYEYGMKFLWVIVTNFFAVAVLRAAIQAPRPFEYDRRLRPLADRQMTSWGFPSSESYMAVVVYGYLGLRIGHPLLQLVTAFLSIFIGFTRIYAGSRFIHQVALSWVLGSIALYYYVSKVEDIIPQWNRKQSRRSIMFIVPFLVIFLTYVCLAIEDNSSNFARVPNSEFIRVMGDIMDSGASGNLPADDVDAADSAGSRPGPPGSQGSADGASTPLVGSSPRESLSVVERRRRALARRHDSFFHLQHTMRSRAVEVSARRSGARNDPDFRVE